MALSKFGILYWNVFIYRIHLTLEYTRIDQTRLEQTRLAQLEVTNRDAQIQLRDYLRANKKLKCVTESIIQVHLEKELGINYLSRKPAPVFDHHLNKEIFPVAQSIDTHLYCSLCPVVNYQLKEICTSLYFSFTRNFREQLGGLLASLSPQRTIQVPLAFLHRHAY